MKKYHVWMLQMTKMEMDVWATSKEDAEVAANQALSHGNDINAVIYSPQVVAVQEASK